MSLGFLEQARNESMARRELSIQSHALLVVRTLDSIYSALQRNPFDGVELDALAAIMYLFDAMLYYADRERQPGMTRKEAELCLVGQAECVSQLLEAEQVEQLLYFGDLDVAGLKIAHQLRCKLLNDYGISLHLDEWLYNELILNGLMTAEGNANNERFDFELQCGWMGFVE